MKLKSLLLILVLSINISFASSFGPSYTVEQIYENFKEEVGADAVEIGSVLLAMGNLFTSADLKGVKHIKVLDVSYCEQDVIWEFKKQTSKIETQLELLTKVKEDGDNIEVYAKINEEIIKELLVIVTGETHVMVRVKGNIELDEWQEVSQSMI